VSDDSLVAVVLEETKDKIHKAIEHTKVEFSTIRTGRATPALVERIKVDYFGTEVPLQQLAGFQVPEARTLVINPYDKASLRSIEKAILTSDLGVNPANDGQVLRLNFPPLNEERRKELVRTVRQRAEDGRIAVRNVRRQARHELEALEHDGEISSNDLERAEKELEHLTHGLIGEIDQLLAHKEQELLEV
jgi:ribosome recycling factor